MFISMLAVILVIGMLPATAFASHRQSDGYPLDLNDNVILSVYTGSVFPGEPYTHMDTSPYVRFNSSFQQSNNGYESYENRASTVLTQNILTDVTQGQNLRYGNRTYYVWGVFDTGTGATSDGLAKYFVNGASNAIFNDANETEMIAKAKNISETAAASYEIVWYIAKYQTSDTAWHIDGIIRPRDAYSVNYYGNNNTGGGAPTGAINQPENTQYTVLGNVGSKGNNQDVLTRVVAGVTYKFIGWNTKADGSGTWYNAGDTVTLNDTTTVDHTLSLYAQW